MAYYLAMRECRLQSNWATKEDGILFPQWSKLPWVELGAVRRKLTEMNRLNDATRVGLVDLKYRQGGALHLLLSDMCELCDTMEASNEIPLLYRACTTRLIIASKMKSLSMKEEYVAATSRVSQLIEKIADMKGTTPKEFSPKVYNILEQQDMHLVGMSKEEDKKKWTEWRDEAKSREDLTSENDLLIGWINALQEHHQQSHGNLEKLHSLQLEALIWQKTTFKLAVSHGHFLARILSTFLRTSARWDEIIQLYDPFLRLYPDFNVPGILERLCDIVLDAAVQLNDAELMRRYRKAHNTYWHQCRFSAGEYDAEGRRVYAFSENAQNDPSFYMREIHHKNPDERCQRAIKVLCRWTRQERAENLLSLDDFQKLFSFMSRVNFELPVGLLGIGEGMEGIVRDAIYGLPDPLPEEQWRPTFRQIQTWLLEPGRPPFPEARHYVLKVLQQSRLYKLRAYWAKMNKLPDAGQARQMKMENENYRWILDHIVPEVRDQSDEIENMAATVNTTLMAMFVPNAASLGLISDEALTRTFEMATELASRYRALGRRNTEYEVHTQRGRLLVQRHNIFQMVPITACLGPLLEAENILREYQMEQSSIKGSRAFVAKSAVAESFDQAALYDHALMACLTAYNQWSRGDFESGDTCGSLFIDWTQKSKARALNDTIGFEIPIPLDMQAAVDSSPSSKGLQDQELAMIRDMPDLDLEEKEKMRKALEEHRQKMRRDPNLKPIMEIRDGTTIDHQGIERLLLELGEGVVVVEYVHVFYMQTMRMIVYRAGSTHVLDIPDIKMIQIKAWVNAHLEQPKAAKDLKKPFFPLKKTPESLADPFKTLALMDKLIDPLAKATSFTSSALGEPLIKPGETIIFCPTKAIHRIPLHALNFRGAPLITRNPVVYCQSLSIFRHCFNLRKTSIQEPGKRTLLHLMQETWPDGTPTSLKTHDMHDLASRLDANLYSGTKHTEASLITAIRGSSLLHYHGHVAYNSARPLSSGLIISSSDSPSSPSGTSNLITASTLFTTPLHPGAHVNLLGCGSGLAPESPSDDLHGLVTALHHAGASSVVGTLWSVDDADAGGWEVGFWSGVEASGAAAGVGEKAERKGNKNEKTKPLNLARMAQRAVVGLMKKEGGEGLKDPYHWAGIVLNGYWGGWNGGLRLTDNDESA
jgi:CHAT domain-containing protein